MKTLRLLGLSALLLAGMPAHAADLGVAPVYKTPSVAPVTTWTGSYLGIAGGGGWGRGLVTNGATGFNETPRFDVNGGIFGITSGFNYQAGSWVLGYEGDTSITSVKGRSFEIAPFTTTFSNQLKEPWLSTYRARFGYANDSWMIYATGGAAMARIEQSALGTGGVPAMSERHWQYGWAAGAGVEMRVAQNWTAKVEYLFVDLNQKSYFNPSPTALSSDQRAKLDEHVFRLGVNYKLPWSILDILGAH